MSIKRTFTQTELEENERMLKEETTSYLDQPLSDTDSETIARMYKMYMEDQKHIVYEAQKGALSFEEIGRRK